MTEKDAPLERVIDANLNRLREGLRVLEDINRYEHNDPHLSRRLKTLRHRVQSAYSPERLRHRDSLGDVLKESTSSEMTRTSLENLVTANFARTEESSRVLEEAFKLTDRQLSALFKEIRYTLYALEKEYFSSQNR